MDRRIADYFTAHRADILEDIARLVAVDSARGEAAPGAPFGPGPRRALDEALAVVTEHGLSGRILGDRVLVAELGEGQPELGILAHLDVVPPAGEWTVAAPFAMRELDGKIYGRGVIDDKGPAVTALYALLCARDLGLVKRKVQLILGSDEECGSGDIAWYMERYEMPPRVFTPDGSFPVVNTEKGRLHFTVTAPAYTGPGPAVKRLSGGTVVNAVPASCEAELTDGEKLTVTGRAAHASKPEEGDNAVTAMLEKLAAREGPGFDAFRALSRAFPHGDNGGLAVGANCADALSGALTVNLGVMSCDETGLTCHVDCRVPVCGDGNAIAAAFQDALGEGLTVEIQSLSAPHHTPADSDFVEGLLKIYADYTGQICQAQSMGGGTYVHEIRGGVAFGAEFPGSDVHMHEPDERVAVSELLLAGEMFAEAVALFCG